MYLSMLSDIQKDLFLDLCIYAAKADGVFEDVEKEYIRGYCQEMQISDVRYEEKRSFDEAVSEMIKNCSKSEIRIIIMELSALLLSDNEYADSEKKFMNELISYAEFDSGEYAEMIELLTNISNSYTKLQNLIFSE